MELCEEGNKFYGNGDFINAFKCYEKSADLGYIIAVNNLACMYHAGQGVKKDLLKAEELYKIAFQKGMNKAMTNLIYLYYTNKLEFDEWEIYKYFFEIGKEDKLKVIFNYDDNHIRFLRKIVIFV